MFVASFWLWIAGAAFAGITRLAPIILCSEVTTKTVAAPETPREALVIPVEQYGISVLIEKPFNGVKAARNGRKSQQSRWIGQVKLVPTPSLPFWAEYGSLAAPVTLFIPTKDFIVILWWFSAVTLVLSLAGAARAETEKLSKKKSVPRRLYPMAILGPILLL